ncbi:MAG: hypothetical protein R3F22_06380 [Lysobacteraceae bacterium]
MFRRAMKRRRLTRCASVRWASRSTSQAVLNGAEIARSEWREAACRCTLRADIDYGFAEASTTYGIIGIKTWVYKG